MTGADSIATLDELAFRAWPAAEVVEADGWRLRATSGVTRRANSAWVSPSAPCDVDHIARSEAFYAARSLPCIVQVATGVTPPALDALLATRGYLLDAPVSVQSADAAFVRARCGATAETCVIERQLSSVWFDTSASERFAAVPSIYRGLLDRLGERAAFARIDADGSCAAVALGVVEDGWCGVFAMLTRAPYRRRGLARQLLGALAEHALERGAARLYLQVERDNHAALALYARLGFVERYGYHYRRRDLGR